ncbi:MAG: hypothetical protein R6X12_07225 [bacterium]
MIPEVLPIIKSRGHWRVNFRPLSASHRLDSSEACREVVERNVLELRGTDYPHYPRKQDTDAELELGKTFCEGRSDWVPFKELWRMYQSGQFIHYVALWEDWHATQQNLFGFKPGDHLSIEGAVYRLTEVFEFAARLARDRSGVYTDGLSIAVSLHGTAHRSLWLRDQQRMPLTGAYQSQQSQVNLGVRNYTPAELLTSSPRESFAATVHLFKAFGWTDPNLEMIREYQDRLLKREARQE